MKILVIGGTHGIGLKVVEEALVAGHAVTVLARNPDKIKIKDENLRVTKGDVLDPAAVESAVRDQEIVCLSLGVKTIMPVIVFSEGTKNTIEAMKKNGARLLIAITGIGAGDSRGHGGFFYDKLLLPLLLKRAYADKDLQEELIRASDLDWIIVRPGALTNGPATGKYRAITDLAGVKAGKISRSDVAHFMLEQAKSPTFLHKTPLLTY